MSYNKDIEQLHTDFHKEIENLGLPLSPKFKAYLHSDFIRFGITDDNGDIEKSSDFQIHKYEKGLKISNASGSFYVEEQNASYWRIIHKALFLIHINSLKPIMDKYITEHYRLENGFLYNTKPNNCHICKHKIYKDGKYTCAEGNNRTIAEFYEKYGERNAEEVGNLQCGYSCFDLSDGLAMLDDMIDRIDNLLDKLQ